MERESTPGRERHESRAGSTYKGFLKDVEALGGFDEKLAEQAAVSVLCALDRRKMFRAVAHDLGRQAGEVEGIVRTVFLALRGHVTEGEAEHVAAQLPEDIADLWMRPT